MEKVKRRYGKNKVDKTIYEWLGFFSIMAASSLERGFASEIWPNKPSKTSQVLPPSAETNAGLPDRMGSKSSNLPSDNLEKSSEYVFIKASIASISQMVMEVKLSKKEKNDEKSYTFKSNTSPVP